MSKFNEGDIVKIVKYARHSWGGEDPDAYQKKAIKDFEQHIGKLALVNSVKDWSDVPEYSIGNIDDLPFSSWWEESQLELVQSHEDRIKHLRKEGRIDA